jgi:hypothetical protein
MVTSQKSFCGTLPANLNNRERLSPLGTEIHGTAIVFEDRPLAS